MGVQVPELKQCVTTLVRLFVSSTPFVGSCFVSSLWCRYFFCFLGKNSLEFFSLSAAPSIVVLCHVSRRARARIVRRERRTLTTRRSSFPFLNQQIHG